MRLSHATIHILAVDDPEAERVRCLWNKFDCFQRPPIMLATFWSKHSPTEFQIEFVWDYEWVRPLQLVA